METHEECGCGSGRRAGTRRTGLSRGTAAGEGGNTIAEAIDTAESVETGLEVASDTTTQLLSGAAVGTGVGLLVGSGVTFIYWRRELQ
ncbi:hypothetical protein [Halovenus salina]|uniref:Uncharacterized protein n=1 Tax=Halovenus salina TaxID=1510225 RepID=A0ABD5W4P0_9EURY